jgi:hypothetical protein
MIKSKGERENERQEKEITPHPPTEINEMDVQVSIIPFHSILFYSIPSCGLFISQPWTRQCDFDLPPSNLFKIVYLVF